MEERYARGFEIKEEIDDCEVPQNEHGLGFPIRMMDPLTTWGSDDKDDFLGFQREEESDVKGKMKKDSGFGIRIKEESDKSKLIEDKSFMDDTPFAGESDVKGKMKKDLGPEFGTWMNNSYSVNTLGDIPYDWPIGVGGEKLETGTVDWTMKLKGEKSDPISQRFTQIQAQLGYDQPSKVLDWLIDVGANTIQELVGLPTSNSHPNFASLAQTMLTHNRTPTSRLLSQDMLGNNPMASCLTENSALDTAGSESYPSNSTGELAERVCLNCLLYCGIFPNDYEVDRDTLIQLWMAAGFITNEPMEDIAAEYLWLLEHESIISVSSQDGSDGKVWYKFNHFSSSEDVSSRISHVRVDARNPTPSHSPEEGPCHVVTVQYSATDFAVLKRFREMRALLFLRGHGSRFERLPYDFLISLKNLETLDLSGTRLLELPTSLGNAKSLRYLNLSDTFIKQLPETVDRLQSLQTLILRRCTRLTSLPKGISKLTSLRHLELDTPSRLRSMPPSMGALTRLHTLSEFPVGVEIHCGVGELKNMNALRGSICLSRLEHVASSVEAREANLINKQGITKLELRWSTHKRRGNISVDDEVMESLRPHTNLKDLRIVCYGGTTFPTWISHPSFVNLVSITLFKCESCQLLPSLGKLPSLESLSLYELEAVRFVDAHVCAGSGNDFAFPKLQKLEIISMLILEEWRDLRHCDFPCLVEITVKDCPKLVGLWRTLGVRSLRYLEIINCPVLQSFPEGDLSVEMLVIEGCPLLTSSFSKEGGQCWHKAVGNPTVFVDRQEVS